MKHRDERRQFWSGVISRFEKSGMTRKEFAVEAGVGLAIFQYWLYKVRREREARAGRAESVPEVRLVPITVKARAVPPASIEIRVAGVRLRVPLGADVEYVGRLATALGDGRRC